MFGGNPNWRGPVWMPGERDDPPRPMILRDLLPFCLYHGDSFEVERPTGSGRMMNLFEVAKFIRLFVCLDSTRLSEAGKRPRS